jgi:catalase (peroxidase I)
MLPADLALLDERFKGHVQDFAKSKQAFFQEFALAFGKLLELGVKRV